MEDVEDLEIKLGGLTVEAVEELEMAGGATVEIVEGIETDAPRERRGNRDHSSMTSMTSMTSMVRSPRLSTSSILFTVHRDLLDALHGPWRPGVDNHLGPPCVNTNGAERTCHAGLAAQPYQGSPSSNGKGRHARTARNRTPHRVR